MVKRFTTNHRTDIQKVNLRFKNSICKEETLIFVLLESFINFFKRKHNNFTSLILSFTLQPFQVPSFQLFPHSCILKLRLFIIIHQYINTTHWNSFCWLGVYGIVTDHCGLDDNEGLHLCVRVILPLPAVFFSSLPKGATLWNFPKHISMSQLASWYSVSYILSALLLHNALWAIEAWSVM